MRVLVMPDYRSLSEQAAHLVTEALRIRPDLTLGLPTGRTPQGMYRELVRRHQQEGADFSRVRTFNLDEYCGLSPQHPCSFHAYMRLSLLDHVNLAPGHVDIPDGEAVDPAAECRRYETAIRDAGGFDLLIAGVGGNGHVAFNEPGSSFASRTRIVSLAPETLANMRQYFNAAEEVPVHAITVGIGTILEARRIIVIASGNAKAQAVERGLKGPVSEAVPVSALQLHPDVTAILDKAAAPGF